MISLMALWLCGNRCYGAHRAYQAQGLWGVGSQGFSGGSCLISAALASTTLNLEPQAPTQKQRFGPGLGSRDSQGYGLGSWVSVLGRQRFRAWAHDSGHLRFRV